jgi:hypothetical protein
MINEHEHMHFSQPWDPRVREDTGIIIPPENAGQWERTSLPLTVSPSYTRIIHNFSQYFDDEMWAIGDESMEQELDILNKLVMIGGRQRY